MPSVQTRGRVDADAEVAFFLGQMQCEVVDVRRKRTSRGRALPKTCFEKNENYNCLTQSINHKKEVVTKLFSVVARGSIGAPTTTSDRAE